MNAIMHRLSGERWWAAEVALRAWGVAMLALSTASTVWLYRSVHQPPQHEASLRELFFGLLAVWGWCLGWLFLVVGQRLFQPIGVPGRGRLV